MESLLVLGVGNMLLTDDGLGVFAAQSLMEESWPEQIVVREAGTFTHDIFYTFKGFSEILVLDVVHGGGKPGDIYLLTEDDLMHNDKQRLSVHDIDLLDSLRMAELYFKQKTHIRVLGMEPADFTTWNIGLSHDVAMRFPDYLLIVKKEIQKIYKTISKK